MIWPLILAALLFLAAPQSADAQACNTATGTGTNLAKAAANLAVNSKCTLPTSGTSVFLTPSPGGDIMEFANRGVWDPTNKKVYFCGASHHGNVQAGCVQYVDSTNAWSAIALPPGVPTGSVACCPEITHAYDHNAFDPVRAHFYHRIYNSTTIHRYNGTSWSTIPSFTLSGGCMPNAGALEFFAEIDRLVFHSSRCGGSLHYFNPANNTWDNQLNLGLAEGEIHNAIINSGAGRILFGGGNNAPNTVYRRQTQTGTITTIATPPSDWRVSSNLMVADPASGRPLMFLMNGTIRSWSRLTNTWANTGVSTDFVADTGAFVVPISTYGVVMLIRGNGGSGVTVELYKHLSAADGDFQKRSDREGVVRVWGFENASELAPDSRGDKVFPAGAGGPIRIALATDQRASGNSSLKATLPGNTGADWGGSWHSNFCENFSSTFPCQFGENETFFVQYRARFDPGLLQQFQTTDPGGPECQGDRRGWKTSILGEGDQVGQPTTFSCTELEIVWQQDSRDTQNDQIGVKYGWPSQYHSCGNFDTYEFFDGTQIRWQSHTTPPLCYHPDDPDNGCFYYRPNEWMTFKVRVDIGTWNAANSRIRWYAAREGQPSQIIMDTASGSPGGIVIHRNIGGGSGTNPNAKYGKIWLIPYHTNKCSSQAHATTFMWWDELIVSSTDIPDPGAAAPSAPSGSPPAQPTNLRVVVP